MVDRFVGFPVEYVKQNRVTGEKVQGTFLVDAQECTLASISRAAVAYMLDNFVSDDELLKCNMHVKNGHKILLSNGDVYYIANIGSLPIINKRRG